jgi:hypothetical protein
MKHHERFYKRLRRDCNIATRPTGISIGALKNATTTTTSRPNATHPPPVTFWVARFIPVDCGQQIQIFGYTVPQPRGGWRNTFLQYHVRLRRPHVFGSSGCDPSFSRTPFPSSSSFSSSSLAQSFLSYG